MKTARFVSVFDEPDPVEYRIVEPSDWSCTCCIDAGTLRMVGPLRPLEQPLSDQRDDNSGSDTQEQDNPCQFPSLLVDQPRFVRHLMMRAHRPALEKQEFTLVLTSREWINAQLEA